MKLKKLLLAMLVLCALSSKAQSLSPDDAVKNALSSAWELKSADYLKRIAALQNTRGAAGGLPLVALSGGYNTASQNADLTFNNGSEVSRKGAASSNLSGGLAVSQNVFNGGRVVNTGKRLSSLESAADQSTLAIKSLLIEKVLNAYYLVVREKQWLRQIAFIDSFYREKLSTTMLLYNNGKASYIDLLQAETDVFSVAATIESRKLSLKSAFTELNFLMTANPESAWETTVNQIPVDLVLPDTSLATLQSKNPEVLKLKNEYEAALFQVKIEKSALYPQLQLGANLNLLRNKSEVGVLLRNITSGTSLGVNLNYPIFNGGVARQNIQIAELRASLAEFALKQSLLRLQTEVSRAMAAFRSAQKIESLQQNILSKQTEIIKITSLSFKLGQASRVELVQAQQTYELAMNNYMESVYQKMLAFHALQRVTATFD